MDPATLQLILALIPLADKLIFEVGGKLMELDTKNVTREELIAAIAASKSESWPQLKFVSPVKEG